jgi:hypothetical protein
MEALLLRMVYTNLFCFSFPLQKNQDNGLLFYLFTVPFHNHFITTSIKSLEWMASDEFTAQSLVCTEKPYGVLVHMTAHNYVLSSANQILLHMNILGHRYPLPQHL